MYFTLQFRLCRVKPSLRDSNGHVRLYRSADSIINSSHMRGVAAASAPHHCAVENLPGRLDEYRTC
jgi:hypothetical protein